MEKETIKTVLTPKDTSQEEINKGFEGIYSLENVDAGSVRRMASINIDEKKENTAYTENTTRKEEQLEFDFGSSYREWMESLRLEEPLSVLNLSYHASKTLQNNKKFKIQDIISIKDNEWTSLKGLGQGHIDEIKQKLSDYLGNDSLYRCYDVDFSSLLYYVFEPIDREKAFLALKIYDLEEFVSLTIAEKNQVTHMDREKQKSWGIKGLEEMRASDNRKLIQDKLEKIISTFVKPWIGRREGIASENEIIERVLSISKNITITRKVWNFLQDLFWQESSFLEDFLYLVDNGIYCYEEFISLEYKSVVRLAQSYFYERHIRYTLRELVSYIERQHAQQWHGFPKNFVGKVIKLSPKFTVGKDLTGEKIVLM